MTIDPGSEILVLAWLQEYIIKNLKIAIESAEANVLELSKEGLSRINHWGGCGAIHRNNVPFLENLF